MRDKTRSFSLPRWRFTRWLTDPVQDVPHEIRLALLASLFGTIPIFIGGVANTVLVAAVIAAWHPTWPFLAWFGFEVVLCLVRTYLIVTAFRSANRGHDTPTDAYIVGALLWAFGVGVGAFMSLLADDWVIAALACLSSAAMMGGICFRNFAAPRLATGMIILSFGPICLGGILSGEPILLLTVLQIPFYLYAMRKAVYHLNRVLVSSMRAERDSEFQAKHDSLTGLPNRRFLWDVGRSSVSQSLAFAMVDIDHFKEVNDTHGHQAGDAVLQMIGRIMTGQLASYGMVGRLGGEEFALITLDSSAEQIRTALEGLAHSVQETPIVASGATIRVTLSAGIAVRRPGETFDQVYAAADRALYQAKRSGRNRIIVAGRDDTGEAALEDHPEESPAQRFEDLPAASAPISSATSAAP